MTTASISRWFCLGVFLASTLWMRAGSITVFVAASLTDALKEIGQSYQHHSGNTVVFNFAASGILERQIEEGAPADIFFSADENKMNVLVAKHFIKVETRTNRLANSLVLIVPKDSTLHLKEGKDLTNAPIHHFAIGESATVPAGMYAETYLKNIHAWQSLQPTLVPMANVRAVLSAVESSDADAGIVYKTDVFSSKKVKIAYEIPRQLTPPIVYPVAELAHAPNIEDAESFLKYLNSDESSKVFKKFGFMMNSRHP